jgi:adenylate cyclase
VTEPDPLTSIEEALLGGERRYTRSDVAALSGVDPGHARKLWMAMGFAAAGEDERIFTDDDVEALGILNELVDTGAIGEDMEVAVARTFGQTFSRLAEWQTREIRSRIGELTDDPKETTEIVLGLLPVIERLQSYVWRRHVAAAGGRALSNQEQGNRETKVIGFADIVGYTTTSRHLDTLGLADLLDTFEQDASEAVAEHHGQVVKTVGDEVLFSVQDPADAAMIALRLSSPLRAEQGLPLLRVGMAMGPVLSRFGDVYGSVVNLAARLTTVAKPGSVLVDRELADRLQDDGRVSLRSLRPVSVRGYHHLRPWVLRDATTDESR